jgi:hypothetical protein
MPLVYYDIVRGRSSDQIRALLDSTQAAITEALEVPDKDRYQMVNEHSPEEMIIQDHGLGIERSENITAVWTRLIWSSRSQRTKAKTGRRLRKITVPEWRS